MDHPIVDHRCDMWIASIVHIIPDIRIGKVNRWLCPLPTTSHPSVLRTRSSEEFHGCDKGSSAGPACVFRNRGGVLA